MGLCYTIRATTVVQSENYQLDPKCNGYAAINEGDQIVQVFQVPIKPPILPTLSGESTGVMGNEGEIFVGNNGVIPILFLPVAGQVNPKVVIVEKYYVS